MPWISQTDSPQKKEQRVVQRFKMWKEKFPTCIRISNKLSLSHMQSVGLQLKSSSRKPPMIIIIHNLLKSTEFAQSWRNTICKATGKAGPPRHRCSLSCVSGSQKQSQRKLYHRPFWWSEHSELKSSFFIVTTMLLEIVNDLTVHTWLKHCWNHLGYFWALSALDSIVVGF